MLLYTAGVAAGRISAHRLMELLSGQPARLFGMYPRKGALAVGSDADIVIFDPEYTGRITAAAQYQAADYTPYEGFETKGWVETVLLSGELAVEDGRVVSRTSGGEGRGGADGLRGGAAVRGEQAALPRGRRAHDRAGHGGGSGGAV